MRNTQLQFRNAFAFLAVATFLWVGPPTFAQSPQDSPPARQDGRGEVAGFDQFVASFEQFLDSHRRISEELRADPSRIRSSQFLETHPELQAYLQSHPAVQQQLTTNSDEFMRAVERRDRTDNDARRDNNVPRDRDVDARRDNDDPRRNNDVRRDNDALRDRDVDTRRDNDDPRRDNDVRADNRASNRGRDTTRGELASFDQFLDRHREIAEQLHKNPSLVNDKTWVQNHPALQTYLQDHKGVREEVAENPNAFMTAENGYERREDNRFGGQVLRNRDTTHGQLASFDQFLDHHHEIAEQLRKDPSLMNNQKWVQEHPALQTYLQDHKGVREEITENPNAFMTAENRYDRREDSFGREMSRGDMRHGDMDSFREFLGSHSSIAQQLHKDPSLAKNQQFLESHPEFRAYLTAHPSVQSALVQDPHSFMKSATETGTTAKTGTTTATVKPTTADPTKPPKL